jgi:hypothetical protein
LVVFWLVRSDIEFGAVEVVGGAGVLLVGLRGVAELGKESVGGVEVADGDFGFVGAVDGVAGDVFDGEGGCGAVVAEPDPPGLVGGVDVEDFGFVFDRYGWS